MIPRITAAVEKNELVIFAGAGISKYLGLPNWKELVIAIYKNVIQIDDEKETLLPAIKSNQLPLLDALELINSYKKEAYTTLKESIDVKLEQPSIHELIWKISPKIITTNYDKGFEKANNLISAIVPDYNFELATLKNQKSFLLKIHGSIENVESCVLFKEDFEKIYKNESLAKSVFEDLIIHNTILFLGFSMSDPYISEIFEYLHSHYFLLLILIGMKRVTIHIMMDPCCVLPSWAWEVMAPV